MVDELFEKEWNNLYQHYKTKDFTEYYAVFYERLASYGEDLFDKAIELKCK